MDTTYWLKEQFIRSTDFNIYTPNLRSAKFIRLLFTDLMKCKNGKTVVVKEFNTSLPPLDRSTIKNVSTCIRTLK